jgi:2-polyprenyl-6-hydroxyphenyl methylase/3-demethylubiquinone-9 3-methyltransferase
VPPLDEPTLVRLTRNEADIAFRRRVRTIMEWIPPEPGDLILDVPCDRGYYLHRYHAVDDECTLIGAELDMSIARTAQAEIGQLGLPVLVGAIEALPFPSGTFDAAIVSEGLEHVDDDVTALREVARVVRPGGLLAITVPHSNYPFLWDPINKVLEGVTGHHISRSPLAGIWANHPRLYKPHQLREVAAAAALEVREERSFTHHCLPFSHNLVYGIGKPLLERNLLPHSLKRAADRHAFGDEPPSRLNPVAADIAVAGRLDHRNLPSEPPGRSTVSLALLAQVPATR